MISGHWQVSNTKSTSQHDLLKAMGKPSWQISVVDHASEDFRLLHYFADKTHVIEKKAKIFLDSKVLALLCKILNIPFNQISYEHTFTCNGNKQDHPNDEKQFGDCSSRSTWDKNGVFVIRWYLTCGILKAVHKVNGNEMRMEIEFVSPCGKKCEAVKVYERAAWTEEDVKHINERGLVLI